METNIDRFVYQEGNGYLVMLDEWEDYPERILSCSSAYMQGGEYAKGCREDCATLGSNNIATYTPRDCECTFYEEGIEDGIPSHCAVCLTKITMLPVSNMIGQLVNVDIDIEEIKQFIGSIGDRFDIFFVETNDGEYESIWGVYGTVPTLDKIAYRLL